MPRRRKWSRLGARGLRSAADLGSDMELAAKELERRRQSHIRQERILTQATAEVTQVWAEIEEKLLDAQASSFGDQEIRELRRYATEERISALGSVSFARVSDDTSGIYKPIYEIVREMADIQVEVFDAVLRACDSRQPGDLDSAIASARYCQSLGEQALMMIPELSQQRKQRERNVWRGCFWGCVGIMGLGLILFVVLVILLTPAGGGNRYGV